MAGMTSTPVFRALRQPRIRLAAAVQHLRARWAAEQALQLRLRAPQLLKSARCQIKDRPGDCVCAVVLWTLEIHADIQRRAKGICLPMTDHSCRGFDRTVKSNQAAVCVRAEHTPGAAHLGITAAQVLGHLGPVVVMYCLQAQQLLILLPRPGHLQCQIRVQLPARGHTSSGGSSAAPLPCYWPLQVVAR